ncbi:MAG: thioredoxin reductase [Candidatus Hydrogenedentota bacterium]
MENVIIIGSGPSAWTAALYAARAALNPLVFEGELSQDILPGGQLMITTEVENYPGFPDGITGPEMMDIFKRQAVRFGTRVESRTITAVNFSQHPLTVSSGNDTWHTKTVIVSTGANAKYLGIESEEKFKNRGVSACATCDGALPRFRNKPLVVVGGGDTAMEEAIFLTNYASMVHVIHRRDAFRASKIMAERALKNPKITPEWNSVLEEVTGTDKDGVTGVRIKDVHSGAIRELPCTGVFVAIGHKPNTDLFKGILDMDETGYLVTKPDSTYTNVDGVFACGDCQDHVYRQAITAAGTGCMAAIDATRWLESQV